MDREVTCTACKTISPIPAYVVCHEFGTFCLQCWKIVQSDYYDYLVGTIPSAGDN